MDAKYLEEEQKRKPPPGVLRQLSAIAAMDYVTKIAKKVSDDTRPWCSNAVLDAAVTALRDLDIGIHFHPERDLKKLFADGEYRNQFETGSSSGAKDLQARHATENR